MLAACSNQIACLDRQQEVRLRNHFLIGQWSATMESRLPDAASPKPGGARRDPQ
jgi:hypothetical protein